jgi:hypothetical protein
LALSAAAAVLTEWRRLMAILAATALAPTPAAALGTGTDGDPSLLVFPSVLGTQRFDADHSGGSAGQAIADVLYTAARGRLRFLTEIDISTENAELDRLQLGWEPLPDSYIWLGKFHEPSSSWNFERDHGHYLQTAISVPAIESPAHDKWGEDSGVLPENVIGILCDTSHRIGGSAALELSVGLGVTSNPIESGNNGYWLRPISRGHQPVGWNVRLAMLPDASSTNSFGLLASEHKLDTTDLANEGLLDARAVRETIFGAYADGEWGPWGLHATLYHIDFSLLDTPHERTQTLVAGYIQLERRFAGDYTVFSRIETSAGARDTDYIKVLQRHFDVRRDMVGVRWDFLRHQAVTLEVARAATLSERYSTVSVQWSAVIP